MIIDSLENTERYLSIHPGFAIAFDYLKTQDLQAIAEGTYQIADGIKAMVTEKTGKTAQESLEKFESHQKYFDIQLCIKGNEEIAWKPLAKCQSIKTPYNEEKDVVFYNDAPDMFFKLTDNQYGIFFPEDAHAAMIGEGVIKKLVVKIRI